ncbi:zinc-binding dehydrogenase [Novosphingobium colocasiae]
MRARSLPPGRWGAHETLRADDPELAGRILDLTDGRGVEAVIDFVGIDATLRLAAAVVAPGGAIQMVGLSGGSLPVEAGDVSTVGLPWGATVSKPYSGSYRDLAEVIALAREGRLTPQDRALRAGRCRGRAGPAGAGRDRWPGGAGPGLNRTATLTADRRRGQWRMDRNA